ncbi:MAG: hypothetical protein KF716_33530 [Anaerolineae bacterium]|nr:hypothetical protein [Anaerolineae bacterium]
MSTRHIQAVVTIAGLAGVLMFSNMMPGTVQAQAPALTDDITITGQIIPDLNTDPQERQKLIEAGEPLNLFKYYLFDANGAEYELQFEDSLLASLGRGFFDKNPSAKSLRIYMADQPQYMGSSVVWQEWTGQWATVTGTRISTNVIQVQLMEKSKPPSTTSTSNLAAARRARHVTYTGKLLPTMSLMTVDSNGISAFTLSVKESDTVRLLLHLFDSTKNLTSVIGTDNTTKSIAEAVGEQCTVTGWIFAHVDIRLPELIYAQLVQIG